MATKSSKRPQRSSESASRPESYVRPSAYMASRVNRDDEAHVFDVLLGPFHDALSLGQVLGISAAEVRGKATSRELLWLQTEDDYVVFPAFQVMSDGALVPGLSLVLIGLEDMPVNEWTKALWLVAENPDLDSLSPIQWLSAGRPVHDVLLCVERESERWRR